MTLVKEINNKIRFELGYINTITLKDLSSKDSKASLLYGIINGNKYQDVKSFILSRTTDEKLLREGKFATMTIIKKGLTKAEILEALNQVDSCFAIEIFIKDSSISITGDNNKVELKYRDKKIFKETIKFMEEYNLEVEG